MATQLDALRRGETVRLGNFELTSTKFDEVVKAAEKYADLCLRHPQHMVMSTLDSFFEQKYQLNQENANILADIVAVSLCQKALAPLGNPPAAAPAAAAAPAKK